MVCSNVRIGTARNISQRWRLSMVISCATLAMNIQDDEQDQAGSTHIHDL
jgi:hypothetical protein